MEAIFKAVGYAIGACIVMAGAGGVIAVIAAPVLFLTHYIFS